MRDDVNAQLEAFIKPKTVAVVGASDRPGSWGAAIMDSLLHWKFPGTVYPVNHRAEAVAGIRTYPDIASIPGAVDLVVLAIPAQSVHNTIRACAQKGVKGITIITAGYGEALPEGRRAEEDLARLAQSSGVRLLGPNVSGTFNLHDQFNGSGNSRSLFPTGVTGICQGGYAFGSLLAAAYEKRMGFGQYIHTGNECDLQVADFLEYFGEDPRSKAIVLYLEAIRDVGKFRKAAARVAAAKPVVVFKAGCTSGGSRAAQSHTGAMAGNVEIYSGLFRQLNLVQSPSMELLISLAHAFLDFPPMRGLRVAIVTQGGSWGVVLTDTLEQRGLRVPELSPSLQARLREMGMPERASTRNPIDIGAVGILALSAEAMIQLAREVLQSGEVDALILHGFGRSGKFASDNPEYQRHMFVFETQVMREYSELMKSCGKPVLLGCPLLSWQSPAVQELIDGGYRIFHRLDEMADILYLKYLHEKRKSDGDDAAAHP